MAARPVLGREGRPIVGVDLGGGRAWSAAVAVWRNGRVEALACAPGIPGLDEQERRDRVPKGTYRALAARGGLRIAEGLRVQPPSELWRAVRDAWGTPQSVICDRFRLGELQDCVNGPPVMPRVSRWSEAAFDIRSLRKLAADGPLAVAESSRPLLAASLSVVLVKNDDQGSMRLSKNGSNKIRLAMTWRRRWCLLRAPMRGRWKNLAPAGSIRGWWNEPTGRNLMLRIFLRSLGWVDRNEFQCISPTVSYHW